MTMSNEDNVAVVSILRTERPSAGFYTFAVSVGFTATAKIAGQQHSIRDNFHQRIKAGIELLQEDKNKPTVEIAENAPQAEQILFETDLLNATRDDPSIKLRKRLEEYGEAITYPFKPMREIFSFLFSLEGDVDLIQICTNEDAIEWDWIADSRSKRLLCEAFGVGVTYATDLSYAMQRGDYAVSSEELAETDHTALIVANSYSRSCANVLPGMDGEMRRLKKSLAARFGSTSTVLLMDASERQIEQALDDMRETLRLVLFTGHFASDGFEASDDCALSPEDVYHCFRDCKFGREPIVVLNGCSADPAANSSRFSIVLPDANPNQRLASAFMNAGAGGCIVTSSEVKFQFALRFLEVFTHELLATGTPVGLALGDARRNLNNQNCLDWASYHLVGDPLDRIVKDP